jgi:hypothetical protein
MEMKLNKEKPIYAKPALIRRINELWDELPMSFLQKKYVPQLRREVVGADRV